MSKLFPDVADADDPPVLNNRPTFPHSTFLHVPQRGDLLLISRLGRALIDFADQIWDAFLADDDNREYEQWAASISGLNAMLDGTRSAVSGPLERS